MCRHVRFLLILPLFFASACGQVRTTHTPFHQPRAAMLQHQGELRVMAGGGIDWEHGQSMAAQATYAVTDGFAVSGALDIDPGGGGEQSTSTHVGGDLAAGAFLAGDPHLRLATFVGLGGGWAEGFGTGMAGEDFLDFEFTQVSGPYLQPFLESSVGFAVPYFEGGVGAVIRGSFADLQTTRMDGSRSQVGYERLLVSPFLALALPIDWFRFEVIGAFSFYAAGEKHSDNRKM